MQRLNFKSSDSLLKTIKWALVDWWLELLSVENGLGIDSNSWST